MAGIVSDLCAITVEHEFMVAMHFLSEFHLPWNMITYVRAIHGGPKIHEIFTINMVSNVSPLKPRLIDVIEASLAELIPWSDNIHEIIGKI